MSSSRRVLVVEDNAINLELVHDLLELAGFEAVEATTVDEARAHLREADLAAVLTDIQVPGGGGEALLREIRANPALSHLPVAAVTAFAMEGDRARFLGLGFDAYVAKPIDTTRFGAMVAQLILGRRLNDAG